MRQGDSWWDSVVSESLQVLVFLVGGSAWFYVACGLLELVSVFE